MSDAEKIMCALYLPRRGLPLVRHPTVELEEAARFVRELSQQPQDWIDLIVTSQRRWRS